MALVIYPTADYDSFISVADATVVIEAYTLYKTQWSALTVLEQEVYLRISARNIIDHTDPDEYPDPFPTCVGDAQALMSVQDVVYGFSASTSTDETGAIKKQKVGSLEIEYFDASSGTTKTVSRIPTLAVPCLEDLGYLFTPSINGLTQTILGRS